MIKKYNIDREVERANKIKMNIEEERGGGERERENKILFRLIIFHSV